MSYAYTAGDLDFKYPGDQLEVALRSANERVQDRITRVQDAERDFTPREAELTRDDREFMAAAKGAIELRSRRVELETEQRERMDRNTAYSERMHQAIAGAVATRRGLSPFFPSADHMEVLSRAYSRMEPVGVVEQRASTTQMGTGVEYAPSGLAAPRSLWRASAIPTHPADGLKGTVPTFTLPAPAAATAEGADHPEFNGVSPSEVTLGRIGTFSSLTSEALLSTSVEELTQAHARILARDADLLAVGVVEGTPSATILTVDEAILTVADAAGRDPSDLWIVGTAADLAPIIGGSARQAASGPDTESFAVRYAGSRVYVSATATATSVTVFDPGSFKAIASPLASQLVHDPASGSRVFGQWLHLAIAPTLVGGAVTVTV